METILLAVGSVALAVAITLRWGVVAQRKEAPESTLPHDLTDMVRGNLESCANLQVRMSELEADHLSVRAAVAHGIEDIERVDNRIKATIRRTTRQLEEAGIESPALEAEAEAFRVIDGGGGDDLELPPVPEELEDTPSSIPGVSAADLAKVRGFRG